MRSEKKKSLLSPIKQNLIKRLSNTEARFRRKMLRILVVVLVLFLAYSFFSGDYGFIRMIRLKAEKRHLTQENHRLLVNLVDIELTKKRLLYDKEFIEYIARTRHLYSHPGEVIYRFK